MTTLPAGIPAPANHSTIPLTAAAAVLGDTRPGASAEPSAGTPPYPHPDGGGGAPWTPGSSSWPCGPDVSGSRTRSGAARLQLLETRRFHPGEVSCSLASGISYATLTGDRAAAPGNLPGHGNTGPRPPIELDLRRRHSP